jgi:hypothetical protein
MHPTGESSAVVQMLLDFLSSPSVRLGVVKSFVAWHVRLTCQMLTTNVTNCKRVGRPQGLNTPPICERKSPLRVETATLTVALPPFPGNIRNICIFLKRKAMEGKKKSTKRAKARNWDAGQEKRSEWEPDETTLVENQIYVGWGPATPRQCNAMSGFFCYLLRRDLNQKRKTRR